MRQTSKEAFSAIQSDGTLGRRQRLALDLLTQYGPMTGNELSQRAACPGLWKRLSELEKAGLIRVASERKCTVTGRNASVWEAIDASGAQLEMFGDVG